MNNVTRIVLTLKLHFKYWQKLKPETDVYIQCNVFVFFHFRKHLNIPEVLIVFGVLKTHRDIDVGNHRLRRMFQGKQGELPCVILHHMPQGTQ